MYYFCIFFLQDNSGIDLRFVLKYLKYQQFNFYPLFKKQAKA